MTTPAAPILPDDIEQQLYDFVRQGSACFMTTVTAAGEPSVRQVAAFVEDGFRASTISMADAPKLRHLRHNPSVSLLFVRTGDGFRARQVTLHGRAELVMDETGLNAFLDRRAAFYGRPIGQHASEVERGLIVVTPTLLRAEGFIGDGPAVIVARTFAPLAASIPGAWG